MTDAEKLAYTVTRERIVNQLDQLKASGGSSSIIKRLGRFGNAFSWYPEFYPQILADINGMSDAELMSALRTEEGFMKLIAPVEGLPIHHKVANRTGGDIPIRTPTDTFLDVRKMFFDKYGGFPGNSAWNLGAHGAFDERMHQGRYGAKDTVFDPRFGYGMPPTEELPIAHGKGTKNIGRALGEDPVLLRSTAEEIFTSLDEFVRPQIAKFQEISTNPVTLNQRAIIQKGLDVDAFAEGRTIEQSTAVREAAKIQGLDVEFAKGFKYDFSGAAAKLITDPETIQQIMRFPNRLMQQVPAPVRQYVPGGAIVGGAMLLGDIAQAAEGVQGAATATDKGELGTSVMETAAGTTAALSALPGLQPLAIPSMVFGATAGAMRMRVTRDQERERTQQVMAGEVSRYGPAVTETPTITKPESAYERRRRARTGR